MNIKKIIFVLAFIIVPCIYSNSGKILKPIFSYSVQIWNPNLLVLIFDKFWSPNIFIFIFDKRWKLKTQMHSYLYAVKFWSPNILVFVFSHNIEICPAMLCIILYSLYSTQCLIYIVFSPLYSMNCIICDVLFAFNCNNYIVIFIL